MCRLSTGGAEFRFYMVGARCWPLFREGAACRICMAGCRGRAPCVVCTKQGVVCRLHAEGCSLSLYVGWCFVCVVHGTLRVGMGGCYMSVVLGECGLYIRVPRSLVHEGGGCCISLARAFQTKIRQFSNLVSKIICWHMCSIPQCSHSREWCCGNFPSRRSKHGITSTTEAQHQKHHH